MIPTSEKFLTGKSVLVTGGGSGIGRAIALAMASRGAQLIIASRRVHYLMKTAEEILSLGVRCEFLDADITRPEDALHIMATIRDKFGGLDVLVNNAGVFRTGKIHDTSL